MSLETVEIPQEQTEEQKKLEQELLLQLASDDGSNIEKTQPPLSSYLNLAPPVTSQNTVEYNEVYNLKTSKSFNILFRRLYHRRSQDATTNNPQLGHDYLKNNVTLIDRRPLRWYRTFRNIAADMTELTNRIETSKKNIEQFKKSLSNFTAEDKLPNSKSNYVALDQSYRQEYTRQTHLLQKMERLEETKKAVILEISAAGYVHQIANSVSTISRPVPETVAGPALSQEDLGKFTSNANWDTILKALDDKLFFKTNPLVIDPAKIDAYNRTKNELISVDTCSTIKSHIKTLEDNISALNAQIGSITKNGEALIQNLIDNCKAKTTVWSNQYNTLAAIYSAAVAWATAMVKLIGKSYDPNDKICIAYVRKGLEAEKYPYSLEVLVQALNSLPTSIQQEVQKRDTAINKSAADQQQKIDDCQKQIDATQGELNSYQANKDQTLYNERLKFILFWNNPEVYDCKIKQEIIDPNSDPLQEFFNKVNFSNTDKRRPYKVHQFTLKVDGYYDQNEQKLEDFMKSPNLASKALLLPCIDENGSISSELLHGIIAPRKPSAQYQQEMPVVRLVETNQLDIAWKRYALSALANTVNLGPGEKKQIVVQSQTKITQTLNKSISNTTEMKRDVSSSFEDNLSSEFSNSYNKSNSDTNASAYKQDNSQSDKFATENSSEKSSNSSVKAQASGSLFGGSLTASGEASKGSSSTQKSTLAQSKEAAIAISQSNSVQNLTTTSRSISAKNNSNRVQKVATETSSYNKLDITSSSSEQYESSATNKEVKHLHNPNEGRSINFTLHQVQNVYHTTASLKDVKIVVNNGHELVLGSGITGTQVYELEDFNKIFKNTAQSKTDILLCAFIARRILRHYTNIGNDIVDNEGLLRLVAKPNENIDISIAELQIILSQLDLCPIAATLNDSQPSPNVPATPTDPQANKEKDTPKIPIVEDKLSAKLIELQAVLNQLQKYSFVLEDKHVLHESEYAVNAPTYHMDTQIGLLTGTEPYIDAQRTLALQKQDNVNDLIKAEAEHIRAKNTNSQPATPPKISNNSFAFLPPIKPLPTIPEPPEVKNIKATVVAKR